MSLLTTPETPDFSPPERTLFDRVTRQIVPSHFFKHVRLIGLIAIGLLILSIFVPWQQTSQGEGSVIAYNANERTYPVTALVSGRIKKWYVNDGDLIKKGDKIVEIIDNDPNFAERVRQSRDAIKAELEANQRVADTAKLNYDRQERLYKQGLSAEKEYEKAKIEYETLAAKVNASTAKLNEMEIKIAQQATQVILAPNDGTITHLISGSLSTRIKSGDTLATFVPVLKNPAVVMYIDPNDMQLLHIGRKVRLQFQGWPSIQFSGWPSVAIGTFGGVIKSIDQHIDPQNGLLRIIVLPDPDDLPWPDYTLLRIGAKIYGTVLLNQVPLGYEWWRRLNNFPPLADKPPSIVKVSK